MSLIYYLLMTDKRVAENDAESMWKFVFISCILITSYYCSVAMINPCIEL